MSFSSPSTPAAPAVPSAADTAAAQTQSNEQTALYNFGLSNPSITSPLGDIQYSAPGEGPQSTANITLSPAEQQILNTNQANIEQQGTTAGAALNNVSNVINTPYNLPAAVPLTSYQQNGGQQDLQNDENAVYGQQTQYLDPQFQQEQSQLQAQLADQGLSPGSAAYNTAMQNFGLQKQQAYSNAQDTAVAQGAQYQSTLSNTGLQNQAQEAQLYTQQYQEPLNLYSSLISGTAPTMPSFGSFNPSTAAPTNTIAAQQLSTNAALNEYNSQVGAANSATSGLFGLGSSLLGAGGQLGAASILSPSDRRLKKNIKRIGQLFSGLPVYEFEYIWDAIKHIGVMADEVKGIFPHAVFRHESGFDMVDYGALI